MNEIEQTIRELQLYVDVRWGDSNDMFNLALTTLREKAEREREKAKGCEYCLTGKHFMSDGEPIYIFENQIVAQSYNESDNVAEINFCPMCGKRLEVEHGN